MDELRTSPNKIAVGHFANLHPSVGCWSRPDGPIGVAVSCHLIAAFRGNRRCSAFDSHHRLDRSEAEIQTRACPSYSHDHSLCLALYLLCGYAARTSSNHLPVFRLIFPKQPTSSSSALKARVGDAGCLHNGPAIPNYPDNFTYAFTRIGGIVFSTANLLAGLVIVVFLSIYLAAEPQVYFSGIRRATARRYRATLDACAASAVRNLRWWLLAQFLSMASIGTLVTLGLWGLGIPLAGTLGIIAALLTFIPNVGPILSVIPAALLAIAISPGKGLLTVLLFIFVHFLEGNVITPLIQRKIVRLPPALTLTAQLILVVIAGPLGVALAAPLTAATLGIFHVLLPAEDVSSDALPPAQPVSK